MNDVAGRLLSPPRSRYKSYVYQLILIAVGAFVAYVGAISVFRAVHERQKTRGNDEADAWLIIDEKELELGRVYETNNYEHVFHMTNCGDRPVTVIGFEKNCECLGISPWSDVTLQPSETRKFTTKLSLVARPHSTRNPAGSPFRIWFAALYTLDNRRERAEWQLSCTIVPTIRGIPPVIEIGSQSDGQGAFERVVVVEATPEIARIDCDAPAQWSVFAVRDEESRSSDRFRVTIRSAGRLTPRQVADVIRFTPVTREEKRLPAKELRIEGEIVSDVIADPRELQHGRQPRGAVIEEAIGFRSLTGRRFRVKEGTSRCDGLQIIRSGGQDDWTYMFRLRIAKVGNQELSAAFVIQDEGGAEYTVVVPVRYQGIEGRPKTGGDAP